MSVFVFHIILPSILEHQFSFKALVCTISLDCCSFRGSASLLLLFCFFLYFCSQIKSSVAVKALVCIVLYAACEWLTALSSLSLFSMCLWHWRRALVLLLEALCARLPASLCGLCLWRWRARGHFTSHTHSDHFEPALLQFLALGGKTVDGIGLGQTETGWRIGGSWHVVYHVTQQRDGGLSLHVLRRDMKEMIMNSTYDYTVV